MHYLFHTTVRLPAPPPQAAADFVLECDNLPAREKQFHRQMELQLLREKEESAALERSRQQVVARCEDMPCSMPPICHKRVIRLYFRFWLCAAAFVMQLCACFQVCTARGEGPNDKQPQGGGAHATGAHGRQGRGTQGMCKKLVMSVTK